MPTINVVAIAVVLASAVGCGADTAGDASGEIAITGAIYVDFHTDSPCAAADAPAELSGVTVGFRGPDGELLGEGMTGPIGFNLLDFGEGKRGWTHPGCRYFAPYSATVTRAASYEVSFRSPPPEIEGAGSWFTGVEDLQSQVISHEDFEATRFAWDFEADPSFVVGH